MSTSGDKTECVSTERNKQDISWNNLPFQWRQTVCSNSTKQDNVRKKEVDMNG